MCVCVTRHTGMLDELVGLCNLLQKVVVCALPNTGFEGMQVVTYLVN